MATSRRSTLLILSLLIASVARPADASSAQLWAFTGNKALLILDTAAVVNVTATNLSTLWRADRLYQGRDPGRIHDPRCIRDLCHAGAQLVGHEVRRQRIGEGLLGCRPTHRSPRRRSARCCDHGPSAGAGSLFLEGERLHDDELLRQPRDPATDPDGDRFRADTNADTDPDPDTRADRDTCTDSDPGTDPDTDFAAPAVCDPDVKWHRRTARTARLFGADARPGIDRAAGTVGRSDTSAFAIDRNRRLRAGNRKPVGRFGWIWRCHGSCQRGPGRGRHGQPRPGGRGRFPPRPLEGSACSSSRRSWRRPAAG